VVLRQPHRAGEKCFVDFCDGLPLFDEHTGERISTELFVGACVFRARKAIDSRQAGPWFHAMSVHCS
jgi:hypothetical protein